MAATVIGGVTLDNEMRWLEEEKDTRIAGSAYTTLGGGRQAQSMRLSDSGRPITLQGTARDGWQYKSTIDSLRALALVPGNTFSVSLWGQTYTCRFRSEAPGGGVEFERVNPSVILANQSWSGNEPQFGTLYLETV